MVAVAVSALVGLVLLVAIYVRGTQRPAGAGAALRPAAAGFSRDAGGRGCAPTPRAPTRRCRRCWPRIRGSCRRASRSRSRSRACTSSSWRRSSPSSRWPCRSPLLLLSSMGIGVAHAVPVTASLGTLEATQVGLFTVGGEPLATGLAVAVAIRLAETLAILVGLACLATAPGWRAERRDDRARMLRTAALRDLRARLDPGVRAAERALSRAARGRDPRRAARDVERRRRRHRPRDPGRDRA